MTNAVVGVKYICMLNVLDALNLGRLAVRDESFGAFSSSVVIQAMYQKIVDSAINDRGE
jgi:hypothetical protein